MEKTLSLDQRATVFCRVSYVLGWCRKTQNHCCIEARGLSTVELCDTQEPVNYSQMIYFFFMKNKNHSLLLMLKSVSWEFQDPELRNASIVALEEASKVKLAGFWDSRQLAPKETIQGVNWGEIFHRINSSGSSLLRATIPRHVGLRLPRNSCLQRVHWTSNSKCEAGTSVTWQISLVPN